jgi:ankyrin repeat protein
MFNRLLTVLLVVVCALPAAAQDVDTAWVRTYNGPGDDTDGANAIGRDTAGNVFVTGASWGSGTNYDLATIKYDPDGTQLWVSRYDGPANGPDDAHALAVDDSGNVCVTGPILASGPTNYDYATIKYGSSLGIQLWFRGIGGVGTDVAQDIGIDASGNFYVTGYFYTSPTWDLDYVTVKYASDGTPLWSRNFNGPSSGDDSASAIAVMSSGDVYVTGQARVASVTRAYGTVKYNSSGSLIWSRYYVGPGGYSSHALAVTVDGSGNVYVTGRSPGVGTGFDYATIKYDAAGTELWVQRYNGPGNGNDEACAIEVDGSGNVYVTGYSIGSGTSADYATVKYSPTGTELWVQRYNGPGNSSDEARDLRLDDSGNVYVTGWSIQSGPGYYFDMATIKYDPDGNMLWEKRYNGPANISDGGNAIDLDGLGNVYVTGYCDHGSGSGDYLTIKYWQNFPPDPFSLLSPENEASFPPGYVDFDWEDAVDPDPWDEIRYDLCLSTSQTFHPDSTVVYDSLLSSEYSDDFEVGTYYWKVRAYDRRSETWSSQTWAFVIDVTLFGTPVKYAVGDYPFSIFCADLDADSDLDLAVANTLSHDVSILKNNGDGSFQDAANYDAGNQPRHVFSADLDGDSDLDLAVANGGSGNVSILRNTGDGTFEYLADYDVGGGPHSVFCADLDGDDDLDLAVANVDSDNVSVLKNNADGTFQDATDYEVGIAPFSVFCADLDGDLDLDLAVANAESDSISILKNNGDGTFQSAVNYEAGDGPRRIFCADLDGDSDFDLAVPNAYSDNVSIMKNSGDGSFQAAVNYWTGDHPACAFCADFDGDVALDLAVPNVYNHYISVRINQGDGTFQYGIDHSPGNQPTFVFCADVDGDGDWDLVSANQAEDSVSVLMNLTQAPANQPPHPFSLFSPQDGSWVPQVLILDWRTPYDPNFGDQIEYDLYISTVPTFDPDFTTIYSGLVTSRDTVTLGIDTYYWKVKAYDNWGAEVWSAQTWSFTTVTSPGLVGYWKFDEGTGDVAYDSSGYGNDGTLKNEAEWVDGLPLLGWALNLDGTNDYVWVPDAPSLDIGGPFTIMTWIKPDSLPTEWLSFVNKYRNYIFQTASSGPRRLRITFVDHALESPDNILEENIWQHIAATWDGEYFRLYRDGSEVAYEYEGPATPPTDDYPLLMGCERESSQFFDGVMDEVKICSRALLPEEIQDEFESGFIRGDANADGIVNVGDVVYLVSYLYKNGPTPNPSDAGDCNCDGIVDLGDVVYLVSYLYKNGPPPSC